MRGESRAAGLIGAVAPVLLFLLVQEIVRTALEIAADRIRLVTAVSPGTLEALLAIASFAAGLFVLLLFFRPDIKAKAAAPSREGAEGASEAAQDSRRRVVRAAAYFLGICALSVGMNLLQSLIAGAGVPVPAVSASAGEGNVPVGLAVAVYGMFTPFAEETVFRAVLFPRLIPLMNRRTAILLSAAVFALWHGTPVQMAYAFAAGLFLAGAYSELGGLLPAVILHASANILAIFCGRAGLFTQYPRSAAWTACAAGVLAVCAFVLLMAPRSSKGGR